MPICPTCKAQSEYGKACPTCIALYYPQFAPVNLEPDYMRHVSAMTSARLNSKADIAVQLAWRDQEIARLKEENASLRLREDAIIQKLHELTSQLKKRRETGGA